MAKIRLYGNKNLLSDFLDVLSEVGVVHLVPVVRRRIGELDEGEILTPCEVGATALERVDAARDLLRQLEEAAVLLGIDLDSPVESGGKEEPLSISEDLPILRELAAKREELLHELVLAKRYRRLCETFGPVIAQLGTLNHVRALGVTMEARYQDQLLPLLRQRLEAITGGGYQMLWRSLDEETLGIVLLFPPAHAAEVASILSEENIQEMRLPKSYEKLSLLDGLGEVERQLRQLPDDLDALDDKFQRYRESYGKRIFAERQRLLDVLQEAEAIGNIAATRFLFVGEGYVPRRRLPPLSMALEAAFASEVKVVEIPIPPEERAKVPVIFTNPLLLRPFERLLRFLPMPQYGTLDPTPILALSFPLFFGVVLGDVGYGLVGLLSAALIALLGRRTPLVRDIAFLLAVVSSVSILFGFVYGEFFGDLGHTLGLRPLWRDRLKAVQALFIFTIALGGAHILLSFTLAIVQNIRDRQKSKAAAKVASLVALAAITMVLAAVSGNLPHGAWLGATVVLIATLVVLLYLEGLISALELISTLGNVLSYTRLMALGLASAALAVVANRLAGTMGNIVAAALVALLLHSLNLVLGVFGSTVHGLRLHFVEFLPRFYKFGGMAYTPYRKGGS